MHNYYIFAHYFWTVFVKFLSRIFIWNIRDWYVFNWNNIFCFSAFSTWVDVCLFFSFCSILDCLNCLWTIFKMFHHLIVFCTLLQCFAHICNVLHTFIMFCTLLYCLNAFRLKNVRVKCRSHVPDLNPFFAPIKRRVVVIFFTQGIFASDVFDWSEVN